MNISYYQIIQIKKLKHCEVPVFSLNSTLPELKTPSCEVRPYSSRENFCEHHITHIYIHYFSRDAMPTCHFKKNHTTK